MIHSLFFTAKESQEVQSENGQFFPFMVYSPLVKGRAGGRMVSIAEVAELADALGSGPSSVQTEWRFESSLRQSGSCTDMQRFDRAYKCRLFFMFL